MNIGISMKFRDDPENYRVLFDQAPDGIYTLNPEGNFVLVNERLCQSLGYTRADLLQQVLQRRFGPVRPAQEGAARCGHAAGPQEGHAGSRHPGGGRRLV